MQSSKYLIRLSSSLAPFNNFFIVFLILENIKEDDNQDKEQKQELITKAITNKIFLTEAFISNSKWSDFDLESSNNFNSYSNSDKVERDISTQNFRDSIQIPSEKQIEGFTCLIAISNMIYTRKKLIRILNRDILIPKQRWRKNKIFATLNYHWKSKRLCLFYI